MSTLSPMRTYARSFWYTLTRTHTVLMSEIVKHCVEPAWSSWPGSDQPLDDLPGHRGYDGNLPGGFGRLLNQRFGIA